MEAPQEVREITPDNFFYFNPITDFFFRSWKRLVSSKTNSFRTALKRVFAEIEGSASIAFFPVASPIIGLATNLGSLHIVTVPEKRILVFASEAYFLQRFFLVLEYIFFQL